MEKFLIVALVAAVLGIKEALATSGGGTQEHSAPLSVFEFMNTTETIWILNTTFRLLVTCNNDKVHNTTAETTYFVRSFLDTTHNWIYKEYRGNVDRKDPRKMVTGFQGTSGGITNDTLLYMEPDGSCGVFTETFYTKPSSAFVTVPPRPDAWFEIRVRNSSVSSVSENCEKFFEQKVSSQRVTTPYKETCQSAILKQNIK